MKFTTVGTTQLATALALAALLSSEVEASKKFVKMIPNGGNVPDTPAIGHPDGTGDDPSTNDFGDAFSEVGNKWTKELCEADSDGDGQTNGQELGDPCCEWNKDTNPVVQWTTGVSHPSDASKTSDPSLWANLCGASESTTESSSTTDAASMSTEPTDANGSGATTSEPNEGSASSSAKDSDESHSHSHGSDMHDSSMSSSNSSSLVSGSASTSGSSSLAVDVGSPSISSDSSRSAIRGSSSESSAASSAHTPSTSSSSSSAPALSGASGVKPILVTAAGIVAVAMAFVA